MPLEPPPSRWDLPAPFTRDESGIVAVGADLEPGTLLGAYRRGMFPMRLGGGPVAWWSPDPRGVLPLNGLMVTRSMRQAQRRFEIRVDSAFEEVMRACADPTRPHGWIDAAFIEAYVRLHELGWAHSVECWRDGVLVGGLYGVAIGGFFAGESMFHHQRDASKVALMALVDLLVDGGATLLDVQWTTEHLASLGAIDVPRTSYLAHLAGAIHRPLPAQWA